MGDRGGELVRPPFLRRLRCTGGAWLCAGGCTARAFSMLTASATQAERQGPGSGLRPGHLPPRMGSGLLDACPFSALASGSQEEAHAGLIPPPPGRQWSHRPCQLRPAKVDLNITSLAPCAPHAHPDGQAQPLGGFPVPEELPRTRGSALPVSQSTLLCAAGILRPRERKGLSRTPQPGSGKGAIVSHHPTPPSPLLDSTCFSPGSSPSGRS